MFLTFYGKITDQWKLWKKLTLPIGDFNCLWINHWSVKLPCNTKITGFVNCATCIAYFA